MKSSLWDYDFPADLEPKTIKRDGMVGFGVVRATFHKDSQMVLVGQGNESINFTLVNFLNLMDQASWYFDEVVSREEK